MDRSEYDEELKARLVSDGASFSKVDIVETSDAPEILETPDTTVTADTPDTSKSDRLPLKALAERKIAANIVDANKADLNKATNKATTYDATEDSAREDSGFSTFLFKHEHVFFWLAAGISLTFLAKWFTSTHGYFEIADPATRQFVSNFIWCAPLAGIWLLYTPQVSRGISALSISTFVSFVFLWPVAAQTCLIVLASRFSRIGRIGRTFCLLLLIVLQLFAATSKFHDQRVRHFDYLQTGAHGVFLEGIARDSRTVGEIILTEKLPVTWLFNFVKVHFRCFDSESPQDASLIPVDRDHVSILIRRHHRYERTFIDLSRKNKPIAEDFIRD